MEKPKIIIIDPNIEFLEALEIRLMHTFRNNVQYVTMTDIRYLDSSSDIIVIRDTLYTGTVIAKKILITHEGDNPDIIAQQVADTLKIRTTRTIGFISATGGSGKTTLALICAELLAKEYSVLYLNTEYIPSHTGYLHAPDLTDLDDASAGSSLYEVTRPYLKTDIFTYLSINDSMGIEAYKKLLEGAVQSKDYDYILVDTDTFNERTNKLISLFDKTVMIAEQTEISIYRTNLLLKSVNPDHLIINKNIGHQRGFIDNLKIGNPVTLVPYAADTNSLKEIGGLINLVHRCKQ